MAISLSVTVSIGLEMMGTFSPMLRVSRVFTSTDEGRTSLKAGSSSTSSKVMPR